jgi:MFS family permease
MTLSLKEKNKTKKLSIIEGSASSTTTGFGEQYIVPFALKIGASSTQIGILSAIPAFVGSLFQIIGAKLTDKYMSRKKLVSLFVLFQALSFFPLFLLPLVTNSFWVLALCFTLYLIFGNLAGPAWSSWLGDVIPKPERGVYFGKRNKITITFLLTSVLISGLILNHYQANIWVGFGILFFLAFMGRFIAFLLFLKHSEPKYTPEIWQDYTFKTFLEDLPKSSFGKFVLFRSLLSFTVMIAAPFFALLLLQEFNLSYLKFSILILVPMIIKALTMTYWGNLTNIIGNKNILTISSVLIGVLPLLWLIASLAFKNTNVFYAILLIELISGFAWAGMELTTFNYMLDASNPKRRVKLFAYFNVVFNSLVMLGGLIGSLLIYVLSKNFQTFNAIMIILLISGVLRLLVAFILTPKVKDIDNHEKIEGKRLFSEVLIQRPLGYASISAINGLAFIENKLKRK